MLCPSCRGDATECDTCDGTGCVCVDCLSPSCVGDCEVDTDCFYDVIGGPPDDFFSIDTEPSAN